MVLLQAKGPNNFQIFDLGQVSPCPDYTTLYQADGEEGGGRVPGGGNHCHYAHKYFITNSQTTNKHLTLG